MIESKDGVLNVPVRGEIILLQIRYLEFIVLLGHPKEITQLSLSLRRYTYDDLVRLRNIPFSVKDKRDYLPLALYELNVTRCWTFVVLVCVGASQMIPLSVLARNLHKRPVHETGSGRGPKEARRTQSAEGCSRDQSE